MAQNVFRTVQRLLDSSGVLEPGATIEFYDAGTTTPRTVYSDRALATSAGTSVTADAAGAIAERWVADSVNLKLVYKDADGATVYTRDYVNDDQILDTDVTYEWGARQDFNAGLQFGDATATLAIESSNPILRFDTNDYLTYVRSTDTAALVINGVIEYTWSATAYTLGGNLLFGADSTHTIGETATRPSVAYIDDIELRPSSSRTPAANGDLSIEATSNTSLTFKLKGSDGTVRTGTVTLS